MAIFSAEESTALVEAREDLGTKTLKVTYGDASTSFRYTTGLMHSCHADIESGYIERAITELAGTNLSPSLTIPSAISDRYVIRLTSNNDITADSVTSVDTSYYLYSDSISTESVTTSYYCHADGMSPSQIFFSNKDLFRHRLKNQLIITRKSRGLPRFDESTPEGRARALLREMVTEREFLRYLKRGCVTVIGKTGLRYEVYGETIDVYAKTVDGKYKKVESICLVFKDHANLPPTDKVIMRKLMIEADEFGMRSISNRWATGSLDKVDPQFRDLIRRPKASSIVA